GSGVSSKEFYAYKASYLFEATFPLVFASKAHFVAAVCQASKGDFLVLGVIRNDTLEILSGNLDQGGPLTLQPDDIIAVVAY
ncbi:MAG: hypothetical protein NTV44_03315, partial [Firmicutes bacterium]|nr:hypothetical protein [Bacillota bacterium]